PLDRVHLDGNIHLHSILPSSRRLEFGAEGILDVNRDLVGRDKNEVKTAVVDGPAGDPPAAGVADAPRLPWRHRRHGGIARVPGLDLDESGDAAAPRDDVDLAERRAGAAGENAIALQPQEPCGPALAALAAALGLASASARQLSHHCRS